MCIRDRFISTLALFLFISWKLTLALVAVTPLLMLITKLYSKKVRPLLDVYKRQAICCGTCRCAYKCEKKLRKNGPSFAF